MAKLYDVLGHNWFFLGTYEADSEQAARDMLARDAGYESEADMVLKLEKPSALTAILRKAGTTEG